MNYVLRNTAVLFVAVSIYLASSLAFAQEYVVGVEDIDYYPIYADRGNEYSGFAREVLDAFAASEGHAFTYKSLPIKRLFNDFVEGKVDFKFPDSSYWKQDIKKGKNVVYSEPVIEYVDGVMVLPENLSKGRDSLKKLGVVRGFTPWDYLDDAKAKKIKIKEHTSLDGLIQLVKNKRIDGVYFNVIVANYFLENTKFEKNLIVFDDSLPHTRSSYYLSTIKHPGLITKFNSFLKENAGLIEQLKVKYSVKLF